MGSFYEPGQYEKEIARKVGILNRASKVRDKIRDFIDENIDEKALQAEVAEMQSKPVVEGLEKLGAKFDNQLGVDFDTAESSKSIINFLDSVKDELQLSLDPTHVVDIEDIKNHMKNAIAELKTLTDAIPRMSPTQLFALQDAPDGYTEHLIDVSDMFERSKMNIPELDQSIDKFADLVSAFKKTLNKYIPGAENIQYMMQQQNQQQTEKQTGSQLNDDDDDDDDDKLESADTESLRRVGLKVPNNTSPNQIQNVLEQVKQEKLAVMVNLQSANDDEDEEVNKQKLNTLTKQEKALDSVVEKFTKKKKTPEKATTSKATSSEATSSKATSSKATSSKATSSKATSSRATSSKATSSKATSSKATSSSSNQAPVQVISPEMEKAITSPEAKKRQSQRQQQAARNNKLTELTNNLEEAEAEHKKLSEKSKKSVKDNIKISALKEKIGNLKVEINGMNGKGASKVPRKRTTRVAKTANGLTPKQFMELQQSGVDQSKLKVGTGSTTAPKNARGLRPYIITGQFFGNLKIDKSVLNEKLRVIAHDGAMKVMDRKIDFDTFDLLTKNFNSKKTYSKLAWDTYTALLALSDLSVVGKRGGVRVDKVRQAVADIRKKKLTGNGIKGCGIKLYKNRTELVNRKKVIQGCIGTGNNNPELKEELTEIDEILNGARAK